MLLKRISAPTLPEALERVKREVGADALLVETRQTPRGYVVVAAREPHLPPVKPGSKPAAKHGAAAPHRFTPGFAPLAHAGEAFGLSPKILIAVERALRGTRVRLERAGDPALAGIASRVLKALIRVEPMALPDWRVTALVGPTGVGKTTTLAKLAARAARERGESIAIVTIDTYRIAAVEQLRAYADLLRAPFEVAFTPLDVRRALDKHAAVDRVFIDTSGRSPFDAEALVKLRGTLEAARPSCALCLPAGARRVDSAAALEAFAALGPDALILTKWDETRVPGETLSLAIEQGLSVSHVTVGQEVPDDIVAADPAVLSATAFGLEEQVVARIL